MQQSGDLPLYDALPSPLPLSAGSSWGLWGPSDVLGCLNLLTPERVRAAMRCVRRGRVIPLDLELRSPAPPLFGRCALDHRVVRRAPGVYDDVVHAWNTQRSSQWDGFGHVGLDSVGHYNGLPRQAHGIDHWARRGIAGRGVVLDVARWRAAEGRPVIADRTDPIGVADLVDALDRQGVTLEVGDVLLVRTGWLAWYRSLDADARRRLAVRPLEACGLAAGEEMARFAWDHRVAAMATDAPAAEAWPPDAFSAGSRGEGASRHWARTGQLSLHARLLVLLGLPLGELWDLDALAEDCARDGVYECLVTSSPIVLPNAVASPPNALAIK